jgi:hypothetical protein
MNREQCQLAKMINETGVTQQYGPWKCLNGHKLAVWAGEDC